MRIEVCEWLPESDIVCEAAVCILHGFGEHSGRYDELAQHLTNRGYAVLAPDLRGHGDSGGKRGHTPFYEMLLDDTDRLIKLARGKHEGLPIVLYGHSFGGNIAVNYMLSVPTDRQEDIKVLLLSSPWLKLAFAPPALKVVIAKIMCGIMPSFSQASGLKAQDLSKVEKVVSDYRSDPLVHDRISASMFCGIYEAGLKAIKNASALKVPTLLMHGTDDRITSFDASRLFAQRAGIICTFKPWSGLYHELHNEPSRQEVYDFTAQWMGDTLKTSH